MDVGPTREKERMLAWIYLKDIGVIGTIVSQPVPWRKHLEALTLTTRTPDVAVPPARGRSGYGGRKVVGASPAIFSL